MRTIGLLILTTFLAGCAASSEHRAVAPAVPAPSEQVVVAPRPASPGPAEQRVAQAPRVPTTLPAITATTAPAFVAAPPPPPAKPKPAAPPDYRQYLLQTPGNWWLRVDRDGGGAYGYGSASEDRATFGAGTFDFLKLGQTLRQRMATDVVPADATTVTLSPRKGIPQEGVVADSPYVRSLFDTAKAHRQDDLAQLDHLESTFPILSK